MKVNTKNIGIVGFGGYVFSYTNMRLELSYFPHWTIMLCFWISVILLGIFLFTPRDEKMHICQTCKAPCHDAVCDACREKALHQIHTIE